MKKISLIIVLALLLMSVSAALAEAPAPELVAGENQGGNLTCAEIGDYEFSTERTNYDEDTDSFDQLFPAGLEVFVESGTYVSWTSTFGIGAVIVKGSNAANVYVYDPQAYADSGLTAPINNSGKPAGLSNITFCWNPEPTPPQWCSPGYWRQPQHLGSWDATGYQTNDSFAAVFGYSLTVSKKNAALAPADPTLLEVLQNPQWYGGDAFNAVGDLLSTAHPDVNFSGERVEDSCPLGRAE